MHLFEILITSLAVSLAAAYAVYAAAFRDRSISNMALALALAATALFLTFDMLASVYTAEFILMKRLSLFAESLMPGSWLLFSVTYARGREAGFSSFKRISLACSLLFPAAVLALPMDSFFYSPDFVSDRMLFLGRNGFIFYVVMLGYMIAALMNLEATLRSASGTDRWKIKLETLGAGALIAVLFFHYSQALLYRTVNMHSLALRSVAALIAVLLMAYSRLRRGNGVKVYVSKEMAYRSAVFLIVGLYLIGLGLMGEGMRYFGNASQKDLAAVMVFLSVLALVIVLLSDKVKRKLKVFLHKNFYSNKYDYRAQWLKFTERLSSSRSREEVLKAILSGFAETFGMKGATLFLKDDGRYRVVSEFETYLGGTALAGENGIVKYLGRKGWVLNPADGNAELSAEERGFLERNNIAFVVPLYLHGGLEGFITLTGPLNMNEIWAYEDFDLMKTLSSQASSTIVNLRLLDELAMAREMEAVGRISAFVAHDLKNLVSTLSLMADNADEHIENPEFQRDMVGSLKVTVGKMKGLISRLKDLKEKDSLNIRRADIYSISKEAVKGISGDIRLEGSPVLAEVDPEEVRKVVLNFVLNSIEACSGKSPVNLEIGAAAGHAFIRVADKGCGMTVEFIRDRLFKPFSTTKEKGLGIGLYQCKQVIEAHGGSIEVSSAPGEGTVFTMKLPLAKGHEDMVNIDDGPAPRNLING